MDFPLKENIFDSKKNQKVIQKSKITSKSKKICINKDLTKEHEKKIEVCSNSNKFCINEGSNNESSKKNINTINEIHIKMNNKKINTPMKEADISQQKEEIIFHNKQ